MKNKQLIPCVALFLLWMVPVFPQQIEKHRDIWLINIPTPYTLGKGEIELDVLGHYTNYGLPDPRNDVIDFVLVGNYGVTEHLTISVTTPFTWIGGSLTDNFGINDISFSFRYKVLDAGIWNIAISPSFFLPTGDDLEFRGSGNFGYQLHLSIGFQKERISIFTNLGYGKTGYVQEVLRPSSSGTRLVEGPGIKSEQVIQFSGGLTFDVIPQITLLLEGVGQIIPEFSDQDFYFQAGGLLRIKNSLLLKGSAGTGLPRDARTITDSRATIGLSYLIR